MYHQGFESLLECLVSVARMPVGYNPLSPFLPRVVCGIIIAVIERLLVGPFRIMSVLPKILLCIHHHTQDLKRYVCNVPLMRFMSGASLMRMCINAAGSSLPKQQGCTEWCTFRAASSALCVWPFIQSAQPGRE